jgi:hypothetical protein
MYLADVVSMRDIIHRSKCMFRESIPESDLEKSAATES